MPGKRKPQASRRKGPPRAKSKPISATNKARLVPPSQLSRRSFSARDRSFHALADMRQGASPSQAARDNGVTLRTIKKYVGSALLQDRPGGRICPTKSGRLVRYLQIPGLQGPVDIAVHGSKEAREILTRNRQDGHGQKHQQQQRDWIHPKDISRCRDTEIQRYQQ